jgi:predicted transcriptional regulator
MPKRSRVQIYFDILSILASGEEKPTRIMYGANLSWRSLQSLFPRLIEQGFIDAANDVRGKRFCITAKGQRALNYYRRAVKELATTAVTLSVT